MKNPAPQIRTALFNLLNGNISYDSQDVPVYSGNGANVPLQVLIRAYSDAPNNTKHNFGTTSDQLIEIISEQVDDRGVIVDDVAEQVMELIQPTPRSTALTTPDFQIVGVKKSQNTLDEDSGSGTRIKRILLRLKFLTVQIN